MEKIIDISGDLIDNEKKVYEKYSKKLREVDEIDKFEHIISEDIFNAIENMEGEVEKYLRKNRIIFEVFQTKNEEGDFIIMVGIDYKKNKEV